MSRDVDIPPLDLLHGSLSLGRAAARAICDAVPVPYRESDMAKALRRTSQVQHYDPEIMNHEGSLEDSGTRKASSLSAQHRGEIFPDESQRSGHKDNSILILSGLMTDLCTRYLVFTDWTTRQNAAYLLELLCIRFRHEILQEIETDLHTLSFMSLSEIDVNAILASNIPLYSSPTGITSSDIDIRDTHWLLRQRKELRRRILKESSFSSTEIKEAAQSNSDVASIYQDIVTDDDLGMGSLHSQNGSRITNTQESLAHLCGRNTDLSQDSPPQQLVDRIAASRGDFTSSWASSLLHFLVFGVVDTHWETRQGCGLGLSKMILGLFGSPSSTSGIAMESLPENVATKPGSPLLRHTLLENIVCSGLCCLMLDRFIDCSGDATSVAVVKEAVAQCVSIAAVHLDLNAAHTVLEIALKMTSHSSEWMVRNSGFILLKYFSPLWLRQNAAAWSYGLNDSMNISSELLRSRYDDITELLGHARLGILDPSDDTVSAAAQTVVSMELVLSGHVDIAEVCGSKICQVLLAIHQRLSSAESVSSVTPKCVCLLDLMRAMLTCASILLRVFPKLDQNEYNIIILTLIESSALSLRISASHFISSRLKCFAITEKLLRHVVLAMQQGSRNEALNSSIANLAVDAIMCAPCLSDQLSLKQEAALLTSLETCGSAVVCDYSRYQFKFNLTDIFRHIAELMVEGDGRIDSIPFLDFMSAFFSCGGLQSKLDESYSISECEDKIAHGWGEGSLAYLCNKYGRSNAVNIEACKSILEIAVRAFRALNPGFDLASATNHLLKILWIAFEASIDQIVEPSLFATQDGASSYKEGSSSILGILKKRFVLNQASKDLEHLFSMIDQEVAQENLERVKKRIKVRIGLNNSNFSGGSDNSVKSATESVEISQIAVDLECAVARWSFMLMIVLRMRAQGIHVAQPDLPPTLISALQSPQIVKRSKRLRMISDLRSRCMGVLQAASCGDRWTELISIAAKNSHRMGNADVDFHLYAVEDVLSEVIVKREETFSAVLDLLDSFTSLELGATILYRSAIGKTGLIIARKVIFDDVDVSVTSKLILCSTMSRLSSDKIQTIEKSILVCSGFEALIQILSRHATESAFLSFISSTSCDKVTEESFSMVGICELIRILKISQYSDVRSTVVSLVEKIKSTSMQLGNDHEINAAYIAMICIVQVFQGEIIKDADNFCYAALEGMNNRSKITRTLALELLRQVAPVLPVSKHDPSSLPHSAVEILKSESSLLHGLDVSADSISKSDARGRVLRSYQWHGVKWITQLWRCGFGGGILSDEMGLGKSIQAIAAIIVRKSENPQIKLPHLVICPSSLTKHWMREIEATVSNDILKSTLLKDFLNYGGLLEPLNNVVVVASYNEVRKNIEQINKLWKFDAIILDEAHLIRNPETALAQAVFRLFSNRRLALTGTPVQNQVEDLWSICNFILPDYLGDNKTFHERTVKPVRRYFRFVDSIQNQTIDLNTSAHKSKFDPKLRGKFGLDELYSAGLTALQKLHEQILPFILRRTKQEVLPELPPKTVLDVYCPMTQLQRSMYDKFQSGQNITDDVLEEAIQHREGVFEESFASSDLSSSTSRAFQTLNYLKLLSVHPALVVDEKMHPEYYRRLISDAACSGKLMALAQLLIDSGVCSDRDATRAFSDLLERSRIDSEGLAIRSSSADASIESRFEVVERNGRRMPVYRKSLTEISTSSVSTNPRTSGEENEKSRDSDDDDEFPPNSRPVKYSLQTSQSNKCVVFAQHRSVLDAIEECVMKAGFPDVVYERLDGSVPMSRRLDIIDRFSNGVTVESKQQQRTDDIRILFMTTRACGLGLNLSAADTVIFVENDWNPFVDLQAMDRTHRIGQIHPVSVYRIIADSTIEARIMALRDRKEDVAGQIINERNTGIADFQAQGMRSTIRSVVANVVGNASLSSSSRTENRAAGELSGLGIDPLPEYELPDNSSYYESFDVALFLRSVT